MRSIVSSWEHGPAHPWLEYEGNRGEGMLGKSRSSSLKGEGKKERERYLHSALGGENYD